MPSDYQAIVYRNVKKATLFRDAYGMEALYQSRGASCERSGYNPGMYCGTERYMDMNDGNASGHLSTVGLQVQACG